MDLKNNKILFGEVLKNPGAEMIFAKLFPELMNPFLLHQAKKMTLENILKISTGPDAQEKIERVIAKLELL
ncbi:hypothetical protein SAMN02745823_02381 [Sporobacter termitidis DSM 10068]|uniref:DUF1858 domain-containing protein n=1 Tax=Sporobacter termitidis DSM 10068 TaxID=1123282 RepID=A0A1M5YE56_9FIRM|nr:hypothetical protein [Sporobacter termitidis]SHI09803.1 hypothetical protein SAMN02745823_02381 [Sporobacter termitidis DSM 10068]